MRNVSSIALALGLFLSSSFVTKAEISSEIPEFDLVLEKCIAVSENPEIADPRNGICITETKIYLGGLLGKPADLVDAKLAELVISLGELPRPGNGLMCDRFDDEIAQAIIVTSESSSDRLQRERFIAIAETIVGNCSDDATTASILESSPLETSDE